MLSPVPAETTVPSDSNEAEEDATETAEVKEATRAAGAEDTADAVGAAGAVIRAAGLAGDSMPLAALPTASPGLATLGSRTGRPSAAAATSGSHCPVAGEKYPVPEASPRSVTGSPPVSRQVSQSCGSSTPATRRALSGSCSASQRSLVTVNDAIGTLRSPRPTTGRRQA